MNNTQFVAVVYTGSGVVLGTYPGESGGEASGPALRQWQNEQGKWEAAKTERPSEPPYWELYRVLRASPRTETEKWTGAPL